MRLTKLAQRDVKESRRRAWWAMGTVALVVRVLIRRLKHVGWGCEAVRRYSVRSLDLLFKPNKNKHYYYLTNLPS